MQRTHDRKTVGAAPCPNCLIMFVFAQITQHIAWIGQHQKYAASNGVELPALDKGIAATGFDCIGKDANNEVEHYQLKQTYPQRLEVLRRFVQRNQRKQLLIKEWQVGGQSRQQDNESTQERYIHVAQTAYAAITLLRKEPSVATIALVHRSIR